MNEIILKSATELVKLIRTKELSSTEVTVAFLNRIHEVNPQINAVVQLDADSALNAARSADKKTLNHNNDLGLLHGLPITIKDLIDIKGFHCSYGSKLYDNYQVEREATCISKLRDAGAIIMGLTNTPELASAYESDNLIYGATNNPYDAALSSGGSSGGESAILAAGGSPFGLGSDGGGSIRVPAHYCGIAGHKPTQGLLSKAGISLPFFGVGCLRPFGTLGPMARYVEDLMLTLPILSGVDAFDPDTVPVNLLDPNTVDISRLKIAYYMDDGCSTPTKDIQDTVLKAAQFFAAAGAEVVEDKPIGIERTYELHWEMYFLFGDSGRSVKDQLSSLKPNDISPLRKQFHSQAYALELDKSELSDRFIEMAVLRSNVYSFLNKYDLVICPPCATVAKPHGTCLNESKDFTYTMLYNNTGQPGTVVRFGTSQCGLPIGVQLVANLWRDDISLACARALEKEFGGWQLPIQPLAASFEKETV
jgi:amidase